MNKDDYKNKYHKQCRTKEGLIANIYNHQKINSRKRNMTLPKYTKEELSEWMYSQQKFHILFRNWEKSDFDKGFRPSVDRKNNSIGYVFSNMQLMTWDENRLKR